MAKRLAIFLCVLLIAVQPRSTSAQTARSRTFASPEEAVRALIGSVKAGNLDELLAIFGPEGQELVSSSEPATGRRNREVFTVAVAEGWRLVDESSGRKTLEIGNENWAFPVPLLKETTGWRFDTAAGKVEVLHRRIGRNELAAIQISRSYVTAQQRYASQEHDGKPVGLYAATFRSARGKENGLFWPTARGQKRSPLGDFVAEAAAEGSLDSKREPPIPFYGYYFRILTAQGAAASGGARSYLVNGEMSGGFALVAWPAQYEATGVMTFIVNQDGVVHEKDLGAGTDSVARKMTLYNPDPSWRPVEP